MWAEASPRLSISPVSRGSFPWILIGAVTFPAGVCVLAAIAGSPGMPGTGGRRPIDLLIWIHMHARSPRRRCPGRLVSLHSGSWQRDPASANGARAEQLPFGDAFPNGENSPPAQSANNDVAKFPLFPRRACAHPKSGGSRQPLDRQVRYYSESVEVASRDFGTSVAATGTGGGLRLKKAP